MKIPSWYKYEPDPNESINKGLGDLIEDLLDRTYLNIPIIFFIRWLKKVTQRHYYKMPLDLIPCGCDRRKEILNHLVPFFWRNSK